MFGKGRDVGNVDNGDAGAASIDGYLGSLTFDGSVVTIHKKIRGDTRVYVSQITGISFENAGVGMKGVRFATAGGTIAGRSKAFGSHKDLASDPYALTFKSGRLDEFKQFSDAIEATRSAGLSTPVSAVVSTDDLTAQLQKLADLRSSGVLSDDEFAAAKARLLS